MRQIRGVLTSAAVWLVTLASCLAFLVFFYRSDLNAWDMPGALNAARYSFEHFWPWFSGWNHQAFGGYPQGYFYPPFFSWLVGLIGQVMPLEASFRLCTALCLLATPVSAYVFLRSLGFAKSPAQVGMLTLQLFLVATKQPGSGLGGTLEGTFFGGLVAAQMGLPLFLFYLAALIRGARNFRFLGLATILLSLTALSHGFIGLGTYFVSAIFFIVLYVRRGKAHILAYAAHVFLFLATTAVWWVPVARYRRLYGSGRYYNSLAMDQTTHVWVVLLFLALTAFSVFRSVRVRNRPLRILLQINVAVLLMYVAIREFPNTVQFLTGSMPLQTDRFVLFLLVFWGTLGGVVLGLLRRRVWAVATLSALLVYATITQIPAIFEYRDREISDPNLDRNQRGLIWTHATDEAFRVVGRMMASGSPHLLSMKLANDWYSTVNGLYVESSAAAPYFTGLLIELGPKSKPEIDYPFIWFPDVDLLNRRAVVQHLTALGVQWILMDRPMDEDLRQKLPIQSHQDFTLSLRENGKVSELEEHYYSLKVPIVEFMKSAPAPVSPKQDWKKLSDQWWKRLDDHSAVPVRTDALTLPFNAPEQTDTVSARYTATDHIEVDVMSQVPRWVYLKVPHFPNWHARVEGQEIPLYLAGAAMTAFQAKGKVSLTFERPIWEKSLYGLMCLSLVVSILIWVFGFKRQIAAPTS